MRFIVMVDSNIPDALIGDEVRIRQVLLNILGNAVKFTEKGFVSFTVSGEKTKENSINLVMEITDSGMGIKQEHLKNLFEEYVQINKDKNIEGAGLGLVISQSIVNIMGGKLEVKSEYGKGSTFTVSFSQKIHLDKAMASVENPDAKNVIVYERRRLHARAIVYAVENLGLSCTHVFSGLELMEKMSKTEYSFLFISYVLYKENKENITRLINQHPDVSTRIVVLIDFSETIIDKNIDILALPVYSITVANIMNGKSKSFLSGENNKLFIEFTAPDAKILIVDDINTNLKVIQGLMLPYNMQLELCNSGKAAIEAVKSKDYDMVFMDHLMPEMDGVETVRRIREMGKDDPYYKYLPIIALTANAVSGTREMFMANSFDDFLSKPIDIIMLNTVLKNWVPKNKWDRSANIPADNADELPDRNIKIEGLDIQTGISGSGKKFEIFLETLYAFSEEGEKRISEVKKSLKKNDLPLYKTHVHGIKSACASIGAVELSGTAKELEMAAVQKDLAFITKHNARFIKAYKILLRNIDLWLNNAIKKSPIEAELIKQELYGLKAALDVSDVIKIHKSIGYLQKLTRGLGVNANIKKIYDCILNDDYEKAASLTKTIINNDSFYTTLQKKEINDNMRFHDCNN